MALESMKMSKREAKKNSVDCVPSEDSGPEYPWGLSITLEGEQLDKLGMSIENLSVGDKVDINAVARINSLNMREDMDDDYESVGLQIIKMEVDE